MARMNVRRDAPAGAEGEEEVPHAAGVSVVLTPVSARDAGIKGVARRLVPGWAGVADADLAVREVEGGITNCMARCDVVGGAAEALAVAGGRATVVVRVFGDDTEAFIDRTHEVAVLKAVTGSGFGAALLGTFENGRVDAWLEAETADAAALRDPGHWPAIAALVARFHRDARCPAMPEKVHLWEVLGRWLALAEAVDVGTAGVALRLGELGAEIEEVRRVCALADSPTVFCHNDLLAGNFMRDREAGRGVGPERVWRVIDFEYGCYNPRGFDLGNHFNEWAGFECEWGKYPSKDAQRAWLRLYRRAATEDREEGSEDEDVAVGRMQVEAEAYTLASHLFWGLWAVLQARYSKIPFDYLRYASLRFDEFRRRKDERLGALEAVHGRAR